MLAYDVRILDLEIFLDISSVINVRFCMMVVHTVFYTFIPHLVSLTVFQIHKSIKLLQEIFDCDTLGHDQKHK